jgi:hypothetical protein
MTVRNDAVTEAIEAANYRAANLWRGDAWLAEYPYTPGAPASEATTGTYERQVNDAVDKAMAKLAAGTKQDRTDAAKGLTVHGGAHYAANPYGFGVRS